MDLTSKLARKSRVALSNPITSLNRISCS